MEGYSLSRGWGTGAHPVIFSVVSCLQNPVHYFHGELLPLKASLGVPVGAEEDKELPEVTSACIEVKGRKGGKLRDEKESYRNRVSGNRERPKRTPDGTLRHATKRDPREELPR